MPDLTRAGAYGGEHWSPRTAPLRDEWRPLRAVLLHRPGPELAVPDPDAALFLASVDPAQGARGRRR